MLFKEPKNLLKGLGWSRWVGEHAHKPPSFVGFHMLLTYIAFPQIMVTPGIMSEFPNLPSVKSIVSLKATHAFSFWLIISFCFTCSEEKQQQKCQNVL